MEKDKDFSATTGTENNDPPVTSHVPHARPLPSDLQGAVGMPAAAPDEADEGLRAIRVLAQKQASGVILTEREMQILAGLPPSNSTLDPPWRSKISRAPDPVPHIPHTVMRGPEKASPPPPIRSNATPQRAEPPSRARPSSPTQPSLVDDVIAAVFGAFIAIPLCDASWHAIVAEGEPLRGAIGLGFGLPIGIAGITYHWWKTKGAWLRDKVHYWGTAAIVLLFAYVAGPTLYKRAVAPTVAAVQTGFTQQEVDQRVAAATADLQSKLNAANTRISSLEATANKGNAPAPPPPPYGPEEIGIRSDIWIAIQADTNAISNAYGYGDSVLGDWQSKVSNNKSGYLENLADFRRMVTEAAAPIEKLRRDYPKYQDISAATDQTYLGPLLDSVDEYSSKISSLSSPLPPNYDKILRPLAGALRIQMQAYVSWLSTLRSTAGTKLNQLELMSGK